jgi:exodeoxyribonuclease V alpha subunit
MLFLQGHGVSPAYAVKIFKTYGQEAIRTVRENPYRLARDIRGIGFKTADKIAREVGIPAESPLRAAAGILHTLSELTDEGHVYVPETELLTAAQEGLEIPAALLPDALGALAAEQAVVVEPLPAGRAVYLAGLHVSETQLARRVADLLRAPRHVAPMDVSGALAGVERKTGVTLTEEQRRAVQLAFREKFLIITGGPGTGKTTIPRARAASSATAGTRWRPTSWSWTRPPWSTFSWPTTWSRPSRSPPRCCSWAMPTSFPPSGPAPSCRISSASPASRPSGSRRSSARPPRAGSSRTPTA